MKLNYAFQGSLFLLSFLSFNSYASSSAFLPLSIMVGLTSSQELPQSHLIDDTTREKARLFLLQQNNSSSTVQTKNTFPIIKKQQIKTYHVTITNENHQLIQSFSFEYPNRQQKIILNKDYSYHDLCLKNNDKIEYSDKKMGVDSFLDFSQTIEDEPALNFNIQFPYFNEINIGDCNIQTPIIQSLQGQFPLPFISIDYDYVIKKSDNSLTDVHYTISLDSYQK